MAFKFKVTKIITRPIIKMVKGVEYYLKFESTVFVGKKIVKPGEEDQPPAMLANVIQLDTGLEGQIIIPKVMQDLLAESYPDASYIGKCFAVTLTRVEGKRYNLVTMNEIEADEAPETADEKAARVAREEKNAAAAGEAAAKAASEKAAAEKSAGTIANKRK